MRWEQLFADLEAQYAALSDAELAGEIADRQRTEFGAITTCERLRGSIGAPVRITLQSGVAVSGVLRRVGADWLLVEESPGSEVLAAFAAIVVIDGLGSNTALPAGELDSRLTLRLALRGLARDRAPVTITVLGAPVAETGTGLELAGTIDRVGADFVELADHAAWEPRRGGAVRTRRLVPLARVLMVRARPWG